MDATMENKMGLPPPYEQLPPNPAPPPSYFATAPEPPPAATAPPRTVVVTPTNDGNPIHPPQAIKLGPGRTGIMCPNCHQSIVTRVHYVANNRTHIVSAGLCIIAGCCCGCFIPYCMKSCKTANHYCPKCRAFIGSHVPS